MTTAIDKIETALLALATAALPDHTTYTELPSNEGIPTSKLPCFVLRIGNPQAIDFEYTAQVKWQASADFECLDIERASQTINQNLRATHAALVRAATTDPTLGGRLQNFQVSGFEPAANEATDLGGALITFELTWFSPSSNIEQLVGVGGQIF